MAIGSNSFEAKNAVFNITDEKNSFSISTTIHWCSSGGAVIITRLKKLLKLRSQNDIELHLKKSKKEIRRERRLCRQHTMRAQNIFLRRI